MRSLKYKGSDTNYSYQMLLASSHKGLEMLILTAPFLLLTSFSMS